MKYENFDNRFPTESDFLFMFDAGHCLWRKPGTATDRFADELMKLEWLRDANNANWYYSKLEVARMIYAACLEKHESVVRSITAEKNALSDLLETERTSARGISNSFNSLRVSIARLRDKRINSVNFFRKCIQKLLKDC